MHVSSYADFKEKVLQPMLSAHKVKQVTERAKLILTMRQDLGSNPIHRAIKSACSVLDITLAPSEQRETAKRLEGL